MIRKKEKTQSTKIKNDKENVTKDAINLKKRLRDYKQLNTYTFNNLN